MKLKAPKLNQTQRIITAFIYLGILMILFKILGGDFGNLIWKTSNDSSIWFYSGAFMIILGSYIVEPFFTKPSDVIANSTAILIALLGISNKQKLIGYQFIFYYALTILIISITTIFFKDTKINFLRKIEKTLYWITDIFGSSTVIFSIVYLSASYSYFADEGKIIAFISIITFWICLTFFDIIGIIIEKFSKLIDFLSDKKKAELGEAIGCENPFFYKVETDSIKNKNQTVKYGDLVLIETSFNTGSVGIVTDIKHLLNKKWLSIYLLQDENGDVIKIDIKNRKEIMGSNSIFSKQNSVYALNLSSITSEILRKKITENSFYKEKEQFIGYVASGSNINTVNFIITKENGENSQLISEGSIIKTLIYGKETLYQVINGNSKEECLENFDHHGFTVGIARKLGNYNKDSKDLNTIKWMPSIYSPIFFATINEISEERIKEIAINSIGRLPETDLEIPIKDIDSIVTHNTAILGILGIGKSCLSYELIKRVSDDGIKVICIDITNEYKKELPSYIQGENTIFSDDENAFNAINSKYEYIHIEGTLPNQKENPEKSGNLYEYRQILNKDLCSFIFNSETIPNSKEFDHTKKIRIYNLDYHKASRGEKVGYKIITTDLTQAEKTRIISEELFKILMKIPLEDTKKAKVLIVFEEAHSLIPEWNSVAYEGDKNATNGTAKVILQGRKYGLGSLVITQRTANVSKSILNQCNTIFALRVFDDTGKTFLENYIGADYSDVLATLEERHAVAIGKGLKLKQPIIIQLNDKKYFTKNN